MIEVNPMLDEGKIPSPLEELKHEYTQSVKRELNKVSEKRTVIVDSDDLSDQLDNHNCLPFLLKFKEEHPDFKITLWAIPSECTEKFLAEVSGYNWIELGIHGYKHDGNYEFANLSMTEAVILLSQAYRHPYFSPIFKAPGWQISDGTYQALKLLGLGLMDQSYNDERRPKEIPTVVFSDTEKMFVHTHTHNVCGNWIEDVLPKAKFDKNTEFKLISECMKLV